MKKVLLSSIAVLSIFAAARVLADDGQHAPKAPAGATYEVRVDPTLDSAKQGEDQGFQPGTESVENKDPKVNGVAVEVETKGSGSDKTIEDVLKSSVDASAKPAAPTMDQKADKADKAAAKMGGEKAAAKTLPNTAAVK